MADDSIFEGLDPEVQALLDAARATSPVEPNAGLLAAMSAAAVAGPLPITSAPRRTKMLGKLITAKALGVVGALALTGGVAAAATGTLPDPVQSPVSHAAEHVGVHIPEGEHGAAVSSVARDKSDDGDGNHGATVSETARDNHGHNKDDATTSTTDVGDDNGGTSNSGPGNSRGHANEHANDDPAGHDANDDRGQHTTTTVGNTGVTTPTTVDDHGGDSGKSGSTSGSSGRNGGESEPGHGGHGGDD